MRLPSVERESSELPAASAEAGGLDQAQEELDSLRRALAEGEVHHMPAPALHARWAAGRLRALRHHGIAQTTLLHYLSGAIREICDCTD